MPCILILIAAWQSGATQIPDEFQHVPDLFRMLDPCVDPLNVPFRELTYKSVFGN